MVTNQQGPQAISFLRLYFIITDLIVSYLLFKGLDISYVTYVMYVTYYIKNMIKLCCTQLNYIALQMVVKEMELWETLKTKITISD